MSKLKVEADTNWKTLIKANPDIVKSKRKDLTKNGRKADHNAESSKKSEEVWFDGVDPIYLEPQQSVKADDDAAANYLLKPNSFKGLTKMVAIDCEMVGVEDGDESILARVSIVNQFGQCVYDKYVKPSEVVTDYRTAVSGIRPSDLTNGDDFKVVQKEVSDILHRRILVGHAVHHDLKVLFLSHPKRDIRDTSRYKPFIRLFNGKTPSLKNLTHQLLGIKVQEGEHDSIQDAQATMRLYTMHRKTWEAQIRSKVRKKKRAFQQHSQS